MKLNEINELDKLLAELTILNNYIMRLDYRIETWQNDLREFVLLKCQSIAALEHLYNEIYRERIVYFCNNGKLPEDLWWDL